MEKILLTGATGFLGKALKKRLEGKNYNVIGTDSRHGDIADKKTFEIFRPENISHVFHLAGKTFVPDSWIDPASFYKINVMGTENVLEYCRKKNAPLTFVSAYIYGQPKTLPISEDHEIIPDNAYAHSKYLAEQLCLFYSREFDVKVNIIRPFNAYGIGQNNKFLIPSIIDQALNMDSIRLKDLSPKRDYIYLDDLIDALIFSISSKNSISVYNIGSGYSISVQGVVDVVQEILGTDKPVISEETTRKNEIHDVIADITRANTELNWYPRYSFYDGIKQIISYERENLADD